MYVSVASETCYRKVWRSSSSQDTCRISRSRPLVRRSVKMVTMWGPTSRLTAWAHSRRRLILIFLLCLWKIPSIIAGVDMVHQHLERYC